MHDGASCHFAELAINRLAEIDVQVFNWPASFADLNPIKEHRDT